MATQHNDPRAAHVVHVFDKATNVQFKHGGYTISLAADGQETIVFDSNGCSVFEVLGTSARAIADCVAWIDNN